GPTITAERVSARVRQVSQHDAASALAAPCERGDVHGRGRLLNPEAGHVSLADAVEPAESPPPGGEGRIEQAGAGGEARPARGQDPLSRYPEADRITAVGSSDAPANA